MMLEIEKLCKRFGGLQVTQELDMHVERGEIVGLIGPNGAGKSTLFNMITGVIPPDGGRITFDGHDITKAPPHKVAALGIGRTFQLNPLFGKFTVLENVETSVYLHPRSTMVDCFFNTKKFQENKQAKHDTAMQILEEIGLMHVKDELAENLPHGYQKMLGVARALATRPTMLLLDEPLGGMNPEEIEYSLKTYAAMRDRGITVLIVEHNMQVMDICDRMIVISTGEKICEGPPARVRADKRVIAVYFGGGGDA